MAKQKNPYGEYENFHNRLRVETTYAEGDVRDHREGFVQQEYRKNLQDNPERNQGMSGFPAMKSVTKAPKPKADKPRSSKSQDKALEDALDKDLSKRNVRRRSK